MLSAIFIMLLYTGKGNPNSSPKVKSEDTEYNSEDILLNEK